MLKVDPCVLPVPLATAGKEHFKLEDGVEQQIIYSLLLNNYFDTEMNIAIIE